MYVRACVHASASVYMCVHAVEIITTNYITIYFQFYKYLYLPELKVQQTPMSVVTFTNHV